jgi:outer membrane protein OmpA-like peptidoglycan-associated protein
MLFASFANAGPYDTDLAGGADHPLLSRYQESLLFMYGDENYGSADLVMSEAGKPVLRKVEGKLSNKIYWAPKGRSPLEVFRNYQQALNAAGFETLFSCETAQCEKLRVQNLISRLPRNAKWQKFSTYTDGIFDSGNQPGFHYLSAKKASPSGVVHVQIGLVGGSDNNKSIQGRVQQFMQIVESAQVETGKVLVDAKAIGNALRSEGKIALYGLQFDTNKASIKPESESTLGEMAKILKSDSALKVYIVGHTDNQGSVDINLPLSQKRAEAVVDALSKKYGIAANRLQARGVADFSPVASNGAEEGRAKNRRVEMVAR